MKKTIVYIDGFNLYYGLLRSSKNKWLDVVAFANSLLPRPDEHEILAVKYFTARVNYDPAEPTAFGYSTTPYPTNGVCGV